MTTIAGFGGAQPPGTIEVIDCTLRDGEQTPGVWFTIAEKRNTNATA